MTAAAFPFLAAVALFLASPLLVVRAKQQIAAWIAESRPYAEVPPTSIPDYLAPEQIDAYVEYAADVVQIVPAITLTGVGIVVALPGSLSPVTAAALMLGVVLLVVIADAVVLAMTPQRYLRRKILGMSPVSAVGILVNLIGFAVVVVGALVERG